MAFSLKTASTIYSAANYGIIAGVLITAIATIFQIWMGRVKEQYSQQALSQANAKIIEARNEGSKARAAAESASNELHSLKAPRDLNKSEADSFIAAMASLSPQKYTAVISSSGFDVRPLWHQLNDLLNKAGWELVDPAGLASGNPPAGIAIEGRPGVMITIAEESPTGTIKAGDKLVQALKKSGIEASLGLGRDQKETRTDVVTLRIGPKPQ
jgi:type II secretory pathway pseudopilin PulG